MPKRKSMFRRSGVSTRNVDPESSSESDEDFKNWSKRIKPNTSAVDSHEEQDNLEEVRGYDSLSNEASSESSDQEYSDDQNSAEREWGDCSGCYDGFNSFEKRHGFLPDDEDSLERQPKISSKKERAGNLKSMKEESFKRRELCRRRREEEEESFMEEEKALPREESFMDTTISNESKSFEDTQERVRVVSLYENRTEIVFMDHPASLPLFGHLKVTLLSGEASIHGYKLAVKKPVKVFSQKQTGLLSITSLTCERNKKKSHHEVKETLQRFMIHMDSKELKEKFKGHMRGFSVAVALQEVILPPALQFLKLYSNEALFFKNFNKNSKSVFTGVPQKEEHLLTFCNEHEKLFKSVYKHLQKLNKNKQNEIEDSAETYFSSWSSESDSSSSDDQKINEKGDMCEKELEAVKLTGSRILIYGPKKSGKSTMLRYLINNFLNSHSEVFFLDTDPGQTEFTPPGVVSLTKITEPLFGPPYTHIQQPLKMIFIGSITAETSPPMHIRSVINLINYFNAKHPHGILLVNTMGWIVDIGKVILQAIKKNLKPTVEIELSDELMPLRCSVEGEVLKCTVGFQRDCSYSTKKGDFRPADLRDWALLSYLGQCQTYFHQPTYLNAMRTVRVCLDNIAVYNFSKRVPYLRYYEALNCSIVALCSVEDSYLLLSTNPEYPNTFEDEPDNECLGYGFVRAVNEEEHLIYIVTPLDMNSLTKVNALLSGNILVPRSVFLDQPILNNELDYTDESVLGRTETRKAIRRRSRISKNDKK